MLFNSSKFIFIFLPLAVSCFFLAEKYFSKNFALTVIIVFSAWFYSSWNPAYLLLLIASITINYCAGILVGKNYSLNVRKLITIGAIFINLFLLIYFKYLAYLLTLFGLPPINLQGWTFEHLALPLGISFWTFQQINFLLERFNNRKHNLNFIDYASIVLFFPHLIAGPIVRTSELEPQINRICNRARDLSADLAIGIFLFTIGLFKKVVLADNLSPIPNALFSNPNQGNLLFGWFAIVSYMLQLYCDFSGYCDMGMGLAKMFGFSFPINFNSPLQATNFIDFWKRWHITLTRFFTDTLHAPLSIALLRRFPDVSENITATLPVIFTFFITGIWHGAGNQFIIFGILNGVIMACCMIYMRHMPYEVLPVPVLKVLNLLLISFVFLFFRAPTLSIAMDVTHLLFDLNGVKNMRESLLTIYNQFGYFRILLFFFVLYFCLFTDNIYSRLQDIFQPVGFKSRINNTAIKFDLKIATLIAILFFISISTLLNSKSSEFIYFQF